MKVLSILAAHWRRLELRSVKRTNDVCSGGKINIIVLSPEQLPDRFPTAISGRRSDSNQPFLITRLDQGHFYMFE